jgi:hypothetical protein
MVEMVKDFFVNGRFRPPATEDEIKQVESELAIQFPNMIRELYLSFDGFREAIGNSAYLLPLMQNEGASSVLEFNKFMREEYIKYYPNLDFSNYLFFGSSSGDESWAINLTNQSQIIAYHHHMENEYEIVGDNILDVYINDQKEFEKVISQS